jgi:hypothetical protein
MSLSEPSKGPEALEDLRTPLEIVNRMQWILFYLSRATRTIKDLRNNYVDAKDAYSKASKLHMRDNAGKGSIADRESNAQLDNWELYEDMVTAEKALQFAKEKKSDLEQELSLLQTESKLVIAEMQMAGRVV